MSDNFTIPFTDIDGDNTAQTLRARPCDLYEITIYNPNTTIAYIQFFDKLATAVTVGTTVPDYILPIPNGLTKDFNPPLRFLVGATYACTTTPTGNGDPTTGLIISALTN